MRLVEFVEDPTREPPPVDALDGVRPRGAHRGLRGVPLGGGQRPRCPEATIRTIYSAEMLEVLRPIMLDDPDTLGMLRRIQAPTLMVWGRDDRVTPLDGAIAPLHSSARRRTCCPTAGTGP